MTSSTPLDSPVLPAEPEPNKVMPPADDPLDLRSRAARIYLLYRPEELSDGQPRALHVAELDRPPIPHRSDKDCWCEPIVFHRDGETGDEIIQHRRMQ